MSKTIVFFGSGPVAARSLELLAKHKDIEAVVTKPRAAHHKGSVPVLELAEKLGLRIHTVTNKASLDELIDTAPFNSELAVLIDFGIIVSQKTIDYFPMGIINSHFSLLPEWRGADPITFSVLSGQANTGVSLMMLTAGMDEGPLLAQAQLAITSGATTPSLTDQLINLSDATLKIIMPKYIDGSIKPYPQPDHEISYSRKLTKDDTWLDFAKPAAQLEREIRAFAGWPKSTFRMGDTSVVVTKAHTIESAEGEAGNRYLTAKRPAISCGQGSLVLDIVKPAGKKEMTSEAFLAGYKSLFLG